MLFKRSLSPIIVTILLVVISVALISTFLIWGKDFAHQNLSSTTSDVVERDLTGLITTRHYSPRHILLSNSSDKDLNIVAYKILLSHDHYLSDYFSIKVYDLSNVLKLQSNKPEILEIDCYPDSSFFIELITDQNVFIKTKVIADAVDSVDPFICGLILDFDSSSGDFIERTGLNLIINNVDIESTGNNYSAFFNGSNSKINCGKSLLPVNETSTFSFWFNAKDYSTETGTIYLGGAILSEQNFIFAIRSDRFTYRTTNGGSDYIIGELSAVLLDEWIFMTFIRYDDGTMTIYRGDLYNPPIRLGSPNKKASSLNKSNQDFYIGGKSSSNMFNGYIKLVKGYLRELSLEEITTLWNNTLYLIE